MNEEVRLNELSIGTDIADFKHDSNCVSKLEFDTYLKNRVERLEQFLDKLLPANLPNHTVVNQAMRYSVLNGGKRIRPLLVYITGEALGASLEKLDNAAIAVELIHCYSLVHDDLPAMDNDNLRRGKPTCHVAFNEATAILSGDALQTLAFYILTDPKFYSELNLSPLLPQQSLQMINLLAKHSGIFGMVGGQARDIEAEGKMQNISLDELCQIHHQKTGALIEASVLLGAIAAGKYSNRDENIIISLQAYARLIGLSFQVQDDILDVEGTTETLGKTRGKDQKQSKATFPALMGISKAKAYARDLHENAVKALECLGSKGIYLAKLSELFINRLH